MIKLVTCNKDFDCHFCEGKSGYALEFIRQRNGHSLGFVYVNLCKDCLKKLTQEFKEIDIC